jgi:hypothetical protein
VHGKESIPFKPGGKSYRYISANGIEKYKKKANAEEYQQGIQGKERHKTWNQLQQSHI